MRVCRIACHAGGAYAGRCRGERVVLLSDLVPIMRFSTILSACSGCCIGMARDACRAAESNSRHRQTALPLPPLTPLFLFFPPSASEPSLPVPGGSEAGKREAEFEELKKGSLTKPLVFRKRGVKDSR
jgi:hypothetical protein